MSSMSDCTLATCPVSESKIGYIANLPGNAFLVAWFALMLLAQLVLSIKYRTWSYLAGQFFGLLLEIIGYAARVKLHSDPFNDGTFITYIITITIAPAFLCYTIYTCFARTVIVYGPELSLLPFRAYTIIFVTMDVACLVLQAVGAGRTQASNITPSELNMGLNILRAGLGLQVASLSIFILLSLDLLYRVVRKRSLWSRHYLQVREKKSFKAMSFGCFAAAVLILIRSAYRVQELENGFSSPAKDAQTLFMVFEGAMIALACLLLVIFHPGPVFGATVWKATGFGSKQPKGKESIHIENCIELSNDHK